MFTHDFVKEGKVGRREIRKTEIVGLSVSGKDDDPEFKRALVRDSPTESGLMQVTWCVGGACVAHHP